MKLTPEEKKGVFVFSGLLVMDRINTPRIERRFCIFRLNCYGQNKYTFTKGKKKKCPPLGVMSPFFHRQCTSQWNWFLDQHTAQVNEPTFDAPRLWNALPGSITDCKYIGALQKTSLSTHLFKFAFN